MKISPTAKSKSLDDLRKLEALWRRCAKGWFLTHWIMLGTNIASAITILIGSRIPELETFVPYATIYVPVSTLIIATLNPSNRATTFIAAYRMLYFALLRQQVSNLAVEKVIAIAEQAETLIHKGGYVPNFSDTPSHEKLPLANLK